MKMFKDGGFFVPFDDIPRGVLVGQYLRYLVPNAAFFRRNKFGFWGKVRPPKPDEFPSLTRALDEVVKASASNSKTSKA